ncbi:MAG TPA: bacillithiol transferase BstA [Bryobacteraceae bacterium]|jgi:uncharacterized damage-inducible protein DinB
MSDPRYPIGKFHRPAEYTTDLRAEHLAELEHAPALMRKAASGLNDEQLDTPYRDGGWTVRQVVHHVPDSHMNSYIRFKWALTEDNPLIKAYHEDLWAELADSKAPIEGSLVLLERLHERWVRLLQSMDEAAWKRTFKHPENGDMALRMALALYAWHGRHHVAHVTALRERMGW